MKKIITTISFSFLLALGIVNSSNAISLEGLSIGISASHGGFYAEGTEKEEIKEYCEQKETDVKHWLNYVAPSTVQSHFTYIGKRMCDPYSIARPIYQRDENGEYVGLTEFKEKW